MNFLKKMLFNRYNHIGTSLVHWTGRSSNSDDDAFKIVEKICESNKLRMSFCPQYNANFKPKIAMVCFTDIPLYLSKTHCNKFGKFGIGFNKSKMIEYGTNPVFYTTNKYLDKIRDVYGILEIMLEEEKDRQWQGSNSKIAAFTEDQTWALNETLSYLQEYSYKNRTDDLSINYNQREWRLSFDCLQLHKSGIKDEAGKKGFTIEDDKSFRTFNFEKNDIDFIIVPKSHKKEAKKIAKIMGCKLKIYENEII